MSEPTEAKITQAELSEMFGATLPVEAWNLLFFDKHGKTLPEVRAVLREIAAKHVASKPIPTDIRKLANRLAELIIVNSGGMPDDLNKAATSEVIAKAILAEREAQRERDAQIAESGEHEACTDWWGHSEGEAIAAAIRNPHAS